jgi:hypothetical protein
VNFPTRRAPSPQIRARDTSLDGAANGSAGVNGAPPFGRTALWGSRWGGIRAPPPRVIPRPPGRPPMGYRRRGISSATRVAAVELH